MKYDPIKNIFAKAIDKNNVARNLFYRALDLLILRQWYVKKYIKMFFKTNDSFTFYDAGAGFCQYTDFVMKRYKNAKIVSMDLKSDYMKSYQRSLNKDQLSRIKVFEGDLQSFVSPEKTDLVIAIDILEHIENDISVLNNFYKSMNNKALLITSTPSNLDKAAAFTAEHVRPGYSPEDLQNKLLNAGFKIKEIRYSYGFWGKIYWNLGMKLPLQILSISKYFLIFMPVYFIVFMPFNLLFMLLDLMIINKAGNGIICIAEK
ncbi:MAG: class I SAM-dependent methyltransferase [Candidatus Cloacimonadales bacterium]|jgi:predicted TPR repeat methyltransferase|nr:class I SAM-dependent methyltransferase [Candidatus Cloacimonadota bacterium]MDX9976418.1 class I SAM-dependent methyltransferase [Candidatus Cloacimonadales bacterium]